MLQDWSHSWYRPGNWSLPIWWTGNLPTRDERSTHAEQRAFYSGAFCRNVLGHTGGIKTLPTQQEKHK